MSNFYTIPTFQDGGWSCECSRALALKLTDSSVPSTKAIPDRAVAARANDVLQGRRYREPANDPRVKAVAARYAGRPGMQ
jgi:hypothetical protein